MTDGVEFDIIFLALPRWDAPYSSTALSLSKALSKITRVFYIDNPVTLPEFVRHRKSDRIQKRKKIWLKGEGFCFPPDPLVPNFFVVTPGLSLPINWLPAGKLYSAFSKVNDRSLSKTINRVISENSIRRFVFVNSFNPLLGNTITFPVQPLLRIYQCVDDISQAPYLHRHGPRLEKSQLRNSDLAIVTSQALKRKCATDCDRTFLLPNAADTASFNRALTAELSRPVEFENLIQGRKVITYIGNLCQRIDYELVRKVAVAHRDKYILLIGPRAKTPDGNSDYVSRSGIEKLPNVILAGRKTLEELPAFLRFSDCCIIPFLCNDLTKSIYPLKINEYLSAGSAVVSTAFSEDIEAFRQVVEVCRNHQQFVDAIDKVIRDDSKAKKIERITYSSGNNWEARARSFIDLSVEFLNHHDRRTGLPQRRD